MSNKNIRSINMNNYVKPDLSGNIYSGNKYILNGINNRYFDFVDDRYIGSWTNGAVIDSFSSYIYGEGLFDKGGIDINQYLSKNDVRDLVFDFKLQGQCAIQVIYNTPIESIGIKRKIVKLEYVNIKKIGINNTPEAHIEPTGYWYCDDWNYQHKWKPVYIPRFGTSDESTELLVIRRENRRHFFSLPDYQSCLQAALNEEEILNYNSSSIRNGFSAGYIVNVVKSGKDTNEAMNILMDELEREFTGSSNADRIFVCMNDNPESKTTFDAIPVSDAHEKYNNTITTTRDVILSAHKVVNSSIFNGTTPTGFSNKADEMEMALKMQYKNQIDPMREIIIDGLECILKYVEPNISLYFKDFDLFGTTSGESVQMAGKPTPPFHDNCKCTLVDDKIVQNGEACDYCRQIIKDNY